MFDYNHNYLDLQRSIAITFKLNVFLFVLNYINLFAHSYK